MNVVRAVELAVARAPDLVVLEGSGAAVPPVRADRTMLVSSAAPGSPLGRGFGAYRVLLADLVVLTMCEPPYASADDVGAAREAVQALAADVPVIATVLRPVPMEPVAGLRVAYFTTARVTGPLADHLREQHGADVRLASGALGDRAQLVSELERPEARDAEAYVVEIKAAAIDVVARSAAERGIPVVFCDNRPTPLPGRPTWTRRCWSWPDGRWGRMPDREPRIRGRGHPLPFSKGRLATTLFLSGFEAEPRTSWPGWWSGL